MTKDIIKIFSTNMKRIRLKNGLTQEELSFKIGAHRNYISDTERGKRNITLRILEKIARGLDVTVAELFTDIKD